MFAKHYPYHQNTLQNYLYAEPYQKHPIMQHSQATGKAVESGKSEE